MSSRTLNEVTLLASRQRVLHLVRRFEHYLARHTRLRLNVGKAAVWNSGGIAPDGLHELSPDARVWFGDPALEPSARGIVPPVATRVAQLALRDGGLGLRSAALHAPAAFWATWADSVQSRPSVAGRAAGCFAPPGPTLAADDADPNVPHRGGWLSCCPRNVHALS